MELPAQGVEQSVFNRIKDRPNLMQGAPMNLRLLAGEAFWVFIGQAGVAVAGLIGLKLLTQVLEPPDFGKLAIANTIVILIGSSSFGPFGEGLSRFWPITKDRGELNVFYALSNRITKYIVCALIAVAFFVSFSLLLFKYPDWAVLTALSSLVGIVSGIYGLRVGIFTASRQRQRTSILHILTIFLKPLFATVFVVLTFSQVNIALAGYLTASLLVLLLAEKWYRQTVRETLPDRMNSGTEKHLFDGLGKEILSYSWPSILWGVFGWIHMSCDRWSLQAFYGSEVVGAFSVISQFSLYPLMLCSGFLGTLFSPIAFQKAGDLSQKHLRESARRILLVMTGIFLLVLLFLVPVFSLFHKEIILLVSNEKFVHFSYLLPVLTAVWGLFYLGQFLTNFGMLLNRPALYIAPKIILSLMAGIGTFYLSRHMGPVGVVWGLGVANFCYVILCLWIAFKLFRTW